MPPAVRTIPRPSISFAWEFLEEALREEVRRDLRFFQLSLSGGHLYPQISAATNVSLYSPGTYFDKRANLAEAVSFHQEPVHAPIDSLRCTHHTARRREHHSFPPVLPRKSRSNSSRPPMSTCSPSPRQGRSGLTLARRDAAQFTWTLKAPDASSSTKNGKPFGKHFAGPSWEANDGSRVTGKAVANAPSPDANSIPWLPRQHRHPRRHRRAFPRHNHPGLNTKGGKAPVSGCDASHVGQEVRAPYTADYLFYSPK